MENTGISGIGICTTPGSLDLEQVTVLADGVGIVHGSPDGGGHLSMRRCTVRGAGEGVEVIKGGAAIRDSTITASPSLFVFEAGVSVFDSELASFEISDLASAVAISRGSVVTGSPAITLPPVPASSVVVTVAYSQIDGVAGDPGFFRCLGAYTPDLVALDGNCQAPSPWE